MNNFQLVVSLMKQDYNNDPEVAEQLYNLYKPVSKAFYELGRPENPNIVQNASFLKGKDLDKYKIMMLDLALHLDSGLSAGVMDDCVLVVNFLGLDRTELRRVFDEEYNELIYHGRYHEGGL